MIMCRNCLTDNRDENNYCTKCGRPLDREINAQMEERKSQRVIKKQKQVNRYDQGVKEWFASKTFKTLLTIGLIGGCCFAACGILFYGSLIGLLENLFSSQPIPADTAPTPMAFHPTYPYVVRVLSDDGPVDIDTTYAITNWLGNNLPADTYYWFIQGWEQRADGTMIVELIGMRLSNPDEDWASPTEVYPAPGSEIIWSGRVAVHGHKVTLLEP